jgi:hypothetical protein
LARRLAIRRRCPCPPILSAKPCAAGAAMAGTMCYGAFLVGPPLIGFLAGVLGL